jgi:hypothetical protein
MHQIPRPRPTPGRGGLVHFTAKPRLRLNLATVSPIPQFPAIPPSAANLSRQTVYDVLRRT